MLDEQVFVADGVEVGREELSKFARALIDTVSAVKMSGAIEDSQQIRLQVSQQVRARMVEYVLTFGEMGHVACNDPDTYVRFTFEMLDRTLIGDGFARCRYDDTFSICEGLGIATKRAAKHIVDTLIDQLSGTYDVSDEDGSEALHQAVGLLAELIGSPCYGIGLSTPVMTIE